MAETQRRPGYSYHRRTAREEGNAGRDQKISVRRLALDALLEISEKNAFCDQVIHRMLQEHPMDKRDRAFFQRLAEGTVERQITIDYVLNQFSKVKVRKMKPVIREILRMGAYQLLYMDHVPDSAVCNESVKLVQKRKIPQLKGFVNGVLRSVVRGRDGIAYPHREELLSYLSVTYSMPEWIVRRFIDAYGEAGAEEICAGFLKGAGRISVRCQGSRHSVEEARASLEGQGVAVEPGILFSDALRLKNIGSVMELEAFRRGMVQVQDESSMVVGAVSGIRPGDVVMDLCAAPGGKSMHAADLLAGQGRVISADLTEEKVEKIRENARRLGYDEIQCYVQDARIFREEWQERADVVIADLPCSGLGVIGKKCDIKYKTLPEDIPGLSKMQREILETLCRYVRPGGRMVYSTCTMAREENEDNVAWIEEHLPLERVSMEELLPEPLRGGTGPEGYVQILPREGLLDGFFVATFRKQSC